MEFTLWLEADELKKAAKKYDVDYAQLKKGVEVEKEHDGRMGKDSKVIKGTEGAIKIAVAHIREDPKYYDKLAVIEDH